MKTKKNFLKKLTAGILGFVMTLGVGAAGYASAAGETKAADTVINPSADFTTKAASCSAYNTTTTYGDWKIKYGANNSNGWAYYKLGGKSATISSSNPAELYSTKVSDDVVDYLIIHGPAGSFAKSGMSINSATLTVSSNSDFSSVIDTVSIGTSDFSSSEYSVTVSPSTSVGQWPKSSYFKVTFVLANTTTTNGVLCVDKVTLYKSSAPSGASISITGGNKTISLTKGGSANTDVAYTSSGTGTLGASLESGTDVATFSLSNGVVTITPSSSTTGTGVYKLTIGSTKSNETISVTVNEAPTPSGDYYEKVTSGLTDWSGKYLIVYETNSVAFDGSLTKLDNTNNYFEVEISNGKIYADDDTESKYFTIAKDSTNSYWTIQSASGYYIGAASSNGLTASTTVSDTQRNTISYSSGTFTIKGNKGGGSKTLSYNTASDQNRFRYLGSTLIQLYKKVESAPTPKVEEVTLTPTGDAELYVNQSQTFTVGISGSNLTGDETVSIIGLSDLDGYVSVTGDTSALKDGDTFTITATAGEGLGEIYASYNNDEVISDKVDVYTFDIVGPANPLVANPTLGTYSTTMYVGKTQTLSFTLNPSDTDEIINVSSSNPSAISLTKVNDTTYQLTANATGSATITVAGAEGTYSSTTNTISVQEDHVTSVELSGSMGKTNYNVGDDWDISNFSVNAYYASAPSTPVSVTTGLTWNHSPAKANEAGTYNVSTSVTYSGVSSNTINTSVTVTVEHGTVESDPLTVAEAIAKTPTTGETAKQYYIKGSVIYKFNNLSSGRFTYDICDPNDENTKFRIYNGFSFNGETFDSVDDLSKYDIVIVKGTLKQYGSTYESEGAVLISQTALAVDEIEVKTPQTQTLYNVGDAFNPEGLVITAYYNDGTHEDIEYDSGDPSGFSFTNVNSDGEVTITYWEASCTQTVTLLVVTDITGVASAPTTVQVGETINPSNVVLNANLQSGGTTTVTPDSVTVDTSSAGTKTATATYNAATGVKTATFSVSVVVAPQTATIVIADVADDNNWKNSIAYPSFTAEGFTFTATDSGNNTKYYESDETWRFYSGGAGITIKPATGSLVTIKSVTSTSDVSISWTVDQETNTASCPNFTATIKIKSFTVEYYPPITISKINLTDGSTTVTSDDLNPSFTLTKEETEFTATYEPDDATDSLTWSLNSDATNLSFDATTHKVTVTDLLANASGVLTVSSTNVHLSVALSYTAPAKTISYISIPAGQTVKNAYVAGETFNPAGLKINITYTNSLYDDEVVPYNGNESNFSFTYKYAGASESDPEIPITTGFSVPEGSSSVDAKIKVYYEDEHGSDDVNTLTVHVSKAVVPVGNLTVSKTSTNLDFFEHNSGKLTASVTPAGATDKTVTWESLTPTIATIDENGNISVVAESINADQTAIFRCTTNGLDADGQPIVKDTSVVIHRHVVESITVADENGNPILGFENFEAGKTYQLTANDKYFDDESGDHIHWDITQGTSAASLSSTTGKTVTLTCTKTVGTLNVGATIHDSARKPLICSIVNQPVSDVTISADKTTLYSNQTALITLSVNQYSVISDDIDIDVSDESIATVTPVENTNNQFTFTASKGGVVTVKISVDGVESNELTFNVVEYLNDISYEGIGETHITTLSTFNVEQSGVTLTDNEGHEFTFTSDAASLTKKEAYIHGGSNSKNVSYLKLESSAFSNYSILKIELWGTSKANTSAYAEVSINGTSLGTSGVYTSNTVDTGGTKFEVENTNELSGNITLEIKRPSLSTGALYINKVVVYYTDPAESGTQHIANTNIDVQAKVLEFAQYFNGLSSITASNWDDINDAYDEMMASFETDDERALAAKMFKYASNSGSSLDTLQQCVKKYDSAFAKLGLTDDQNFMNREKIDISCSIDVSIGFQFTGLDVTKFEFIFTGDYTAENPSSYGFMISKNIDTLNTCIKEGETSGSGVTTFVCDDDEAKCVAGVSVKTGSKLTYNAVFYYVENGEIHYSEVITICINDYLLSDEFNIDSITDPYAKAAIQAYIASLSDK